MGDQGDLDHIGEWSPFRIEVQDTPVRPVNSGGAAGPDVQRYGPHVDQVQEGGFIVADEVVDIPLGLLAPHSLRAYPLGHMPRRILLKERFSGDAVRIAGEHYGAVLKIWEHPGRYGSIVFDEIALGVAIVGPESFRSVGELYLAIRLPGPSLGARDSR